MKEFKDVMVDFNDAMSACYDQNQQCLADYEFATVTGAMWRGSNYEKQFANKPKPEINKIFSGINKILGQKQRLEMNAKIAAGTDDATDDDAELLQGMWRNDFQTSQGIEALNNADKEAFFSGYGAYKLVTKYEDEENPDPNKQYICVEPIYSAASSVLFSPSTRKDKSDCKQGWHIVRTNRKSLQEEYGVDLVSSVGTGMEWFDWNTRTDKDIYVAHYYEVVVKKLTDYIFPNITVTAGDGIYDQEGNKLTREDLNYLLDTYEHEVVKRKVKRTEYALISGSGFLTKPAKQPFKRVPIFPQYGYYTVINGIEYYSGEVSKRRDPQMFYNTFASALMQIMAADQVEKPEYTPDQINRHAAQRARADIDAVPYLLSDPIRNDDGTIAHIGPIGRKTPPQIGTGLAAAGQFLDSTLVTMESSGQSTLPSNVSGDAVRQINERHDDAFQPLMQNSVFTSRVCCECWIDAAKVIYFSNQRRVRTLSQDGTYSSAMTLEYGDDGNGNWGAYKNAARGKYVVQVKAGETYKSKKEAELDTTLKMLNFADTNTPQGQMLLNQAIMSTTGEGGERARKVAKYQTINLLIEMGLDPDPQTEEEKQYVEARLQQMQQPKQPTPLEQAELLKGQADIMEQENRRTEIDLQVAKLQEESMKKEQKQRLDEFNAQVNAQDKALGRAIEVTKMEQEYSKNLNQEVAGNRIN